MMKPNNIPENQIQNKIFGFVEEPRLKTLIEFEILPVDSKRAIVLLAGNEVLGARTVADFFKVYNDIYYGNKERYLANKHNCVPDKVLELEIEFSIPSNNTKDKDDDVNDSLDMDSDSRLDDSPVATDK